MTRDGADDGKGKAQATARLPFERHRREPHISIDQHVRRRQLELGGRLARRVPLYLDTKYWIIARDVALGRRARPDEVELLRLLRELAGAGSAFCPISESVFMEVLKQADPASRTCVAELVDELSLGVALCPFVERVGTELAYLLHRLQGHSVFALEALVWSKLSYVLGVTHPTHTSFDENAELFIQKAFFDHMWEMSLTQMFQTIGNAMPPGDSFGRTAEVLNAGNRNHVREIGSYKQAYRAEIAGGIGLFTNLGLEIMAEMEQRATGSVAQSTPEQKAEYHRVLQGILTEGLCQGKFILDLRTLHVHACCHAAVRWDKQRLLKANDFCDFHHAAAAIGYCRAFFTERSLKTLVTQQHVRLAQDFNCIVLSEVGEVLGYLRRLGDA
jgi:hypothetical protein